MRLVYIVTRSDRIGGALVHVRDLALAMQQAGHEVTVLAGGTGCFTDQLRDRGIPYVTLRHLSRDISVVADACALFELRSVLKRLRPHLVSTHQSKAGWLGRLAARSLGIPVVFTAHGWSFTDGVPEGAATIHRWAERLAAPLADRIITVSDFDRALALRQRVATDHKLVSVHNGMPDVSPALRAAPERCPPRLIMVARFEAQKDHRTLLRALGALAHLDWSLELIGDGPLLPEARVLARTVGIADRVRFLGARDDVAQRLARAQLFLLITHWEGFPRSILEAMRAGLPVVASRAGGAAESVLDGETGVVVPPDSEAALRQALEPLLANAALRERLGAAGRQRYEASFTFDHMLDKTVAVYEAVLPARRVDVPQPFVIADRRPATAIGSSGP